MGSTLGNAGNALGTAASGAVVMGFQRGDVLQIKRNINGLPIANAYDVLAHVSEDNGNALIRLGHESITLLGVKAIDIHNNPTGFFVIH